MIQMNEEAAIEYSLEIAKIICERENSGIGANKGSAEYLADFIEALEDRLTGKTSSN